MKYIFQINHTTKRKILAIVCYPGLVKSNGDAKEKNILQYVYVLFKLSHYNIPQLNRR